MTRIRRKRPIKLPRQTLANRTTVLETTRSYDWNWRNRHFSLAEFPPLFPTEKYKRDFIQKPRKPSIGFALKETIEVERNICLD